MTDYTAHGAPAMTDARRRMFRGSFLLFILAEAMIFVTLFSTRFLLASTGHPDTVNQMLGGAITAVLVVSILPLMMGLSRVRQGKPGAMALRVAAGLGVLALALIVYDWLTLAEPIGTRYGEIYVMSTGYHALHIVLGLIGLVVVSGADRRGAYSAKNHWQAEAATVFWWFVIASWVALYFVFYVL